MICAICGGPVEWQGPMSALSHTQCLSCGQTNCQTSEGEESRAENGLFQRERLGFMGAAAEVDSSAFAEEWEAFCKADHTAYKTNRPPPVITDFLSGSDFFNAMERWTDDYRRHYIRAGEAWWNHRGFTVTEWPRGSLQITVSALPVEHCPANSEGDPAMCQIAEAIRTRGQS